MLKKYVAESYNNISNLTCDPMPDFFSECTKVYPDGTPVIKDKPEIRKKKKYNPESSAILPSPKFLELVFKSIYKFDYKLKNHKLTHKSFAKTIMDLVRVVQRSDYTIHTNSYFGYAFAISNSYLNTAISGFRTHQKFIIKFLGKKVTGSSYFKTTNGYIFNFELQEAALSSQRYDNESNVQDYIADAIKKYLDNIDAGKSLDDSIKYALISYKKIYKSKKNKLRKLTKTEINHILEVGNGLDKIYTDYKNKKITKKELLRRQAYIVRNLYKKINQRAILTAKQIQAFKYIFDMSDNWIKDKDANLFDKKLIPENYFKPNKSNEKTFNKLEIFNVDKQLIFKWLDIYLNTLKNIEINKRTINGDIKNIFEKDFQKSLRQRDNIYLLNVLRNLLYNFIFFTCGFDPKLKLPGCNIKKFEQQISVLKKKINKYETFGLPLNISVSKKFGRQYSILSNIKKSARKILFADYIDIDISNEIYSILYHVHKDEFDFKALHYYNKNPKGIQKELAVDAFKLNLIKKMSFVKKSKIYNTGLKAVNKIVDYAVLDTIKNSADEYIVLKDISLNGNNSIIQKYITAIKSKFIALADNKATFYFKDKDLALSDRTALSEVLSSSKFVNDFKSDLNKIRKKYGNDYIHKLYMNVETFIFTSITNIIKEKTDITPINLFDGILIPKNVLNNDDIFKIQTICNLNGLKIKGLTGLKSNKDIVKKLNKIQKEIAPNIEINKEFKYKRYEFLDKKNIKNDAKTINKAILFKLYQLQKMHSSGKDTEKYNKICKKLEEKAELYDKHLNNKLTNKLLKEDNENSIPFIFIDDFFKALDAMHLNIPLAQHERLKLAIKFYKKIGNKIFLTPLDVIKTLDDIKDYKTSLSDFISMIKEVVKMDLNKTFDINVNKTLSTTISDWLKKITTFNVSFYSNDFKERIDDIQLILLILEKLYQFSDTVSTLLLIQDTKDIKIKNSFVTRGITQKIYNKESLRISKSKNIKKYYYDSVSINLRINNKNVSLKYPTIVPYTENKDVTYLIETIKTFKDNYSNIFSFKNNPSLVQFLKTVAPSMQLDQDDFNNKTLNFVTSTKFTTESKLPVILTKNLFFSQVSKNFDSVKTLLTSCKDFANPSRNIINYTIVYTAFFKEYINSFFSENHFIHLMQIYNIVHIMNLESLKKENIWSQGESGNFLIRHDMPRIRIL